MRSVIAKTCALWVLLAGVARAQPLPLEEALRRVRDESPQVQGAAQRLAAARGDLTQAGRRPNPLLELREENVRFESGRLSASDPPIDFFATVSQTIELGGKRAERRAVASAEVAAVTADQQRVRREIVLETARRYLGALRAREELQALQEARSQFQGLVDTMQKRVRDGYAPEADLMKFRSEAARQDLALAHLRVELDRHTAALAALLGEPLPVAESRLQRPAPLALPPGERAALVEAALQRYPDLQAANARLDGAQHRLALERARRIPDPAVVAGYKRTSRADTVVTGVSVPLPVFDRNQGNVARAAAEESAAHFDREVLRRQVAAEIETLLVTAEQLAGRARTVEEDLVRPAEVVRNAARSSFREGATNILQLVDAERVYTEAQRSAVTLVVDAYAAALAARLACQEEALP